MGCRLIRLISGLLFLLSSACALAVDPADLFAAETPVSDEGSETRNAALSELLAVVLGRVSGNPAVAGQPAAREILDEAPSLVQQYRYRTAAGDAEVIRYLWARFDPSGVERRMRDAKLPVWTQRPRVLLWLATEQAGQRRLLNIDSEAALRSAAISQARQRGMPLQLPLLDLEDQAKLTPADLWSDYQTAIRLASARYPHDRILTGRLRAQGNGKWRGIWSLLGGSDSQTFETPPQVLDQAIAFAIDQAQNLLAARYAPMPGSGGTGGTLVRFSGVYDLAAYGRLIATLDALEPVMHSALRHAQGDAFWFDLRLRGSQQDLQRALDIAGRVAAEPGPQRPIPSFAPNPNSPDGPAVSAGEPEADLYYRLLN